MSKVWTNRNCYRCKNQLFDGPWLYFRPKDKSRWMVFCREDCARLAVGKDAKLYTREEHVAIVVHEAIKRK